MKNEIKILILNFNGRQFLEDCLNSIISINYDYYSITVIDNHSTDGSIEYIKENYSDISIVETKENLMFSGGYNYFFTHNRDDCFYMILNNDTIVDKEILNNFINGINQYGEDNIYGPKIMYVKDKNKIWYAGGKVNLNRGILIIDKIPVCFNDKRIYETSNLIFLFFIEPET